MSTPAKAWQRKGTVVLGAVAAAVLAFATTTRTWLDVTLPEAAVQTPQVAVPGSDAATSVTAFALVALAAALAASIAGRIARAVIAVVLLLAGAGVIVASWVIIRDPAQGAAGAIGEATGVSGGAGIEVHMTVMPWLALAAGVLILLSAVWLAVAGRGWKASRRYSTAAAHTDGEPIDDIDSWDRLSRGEDPTGR